MLDPDNRGSLPASDRHEAGDVGHHFVPGVRACDDARLHVDHEKGGVRTVLQGGHRFAFSWFQIDRQAPVLRVVAQGVSEHPRRVVRGERGLQVSCAAGQMKSPGQTPKPSDTLARALGNATQALRAGRPTEAERFAAPVLTAEPDNLLAAQVLGTALLMQGRAAEALEPLQTAARQSTDPSTGIYFARALSAVGRRDEALAQLRDCAAQRPPFVQAFLALGDQLTEAGLYDEAGEVFETGLSLLPQATPLRIGLGYLHLRLNARARARELFSQARAAAPERRDAAIALARVMALDGETEAAIELFRVALASQPRDSVVQIELGKCLLDLGERKAGEAMLRAGARGPTQWGPALRALAAGAHGRFFLKPSAAARFFQNP